MRVDDRQRKKSQKRRRGQRQQDGFIENPTPGTLISKQITKSNDGREFFLCAQNVTQGCLNATKYIMIHNESELFGPSDIHDLTHKMCYSYYNWPGAIRVPAPLQYADKLG